MPPFLRGEVARLVLSYTLEEQLARTTSAFLAESKDIPQDMKDMDSEEQKEYCLVNDRTLMDVLKEYVSLVSEVKKISIEFDKKEYDSMKFEPPVKILRTTIINMKQKELEKDYEEEEKLKKKERKKQLKTMYKTIIPTKPSTEVAAEIVIHLPPASSSQVSLPQGADIPSEKESLPLISSSTPGASIPVINIPDSRQTKPSKPNHNQTKPAGQKSKEDSDEEFLKGLLGGLGESIANVIPSSLNKESIGDVADNCLENPDLFQGLYNLFDTYQQQECLDSSFEEARSRMSTPVPEVLPENLVEPEPEPGQPTKQSSVLVQPSSTFTQEPRLSFPSDSTEQISSKNKTPANEVLAPKSIKSKSFGETVNSNSATPESKSPPSKGGRSENYEHDKTPSVSSDTLSQEPRRNRRKVTKPKHKNDKSVTSEGNVSGLAGSILSKLVNLSSSKTLSPERVEKAASPMLKNPSEEKNVSKSKSASRLHKLINISTKHKKDKSFDKSENKKKSKDESCSTSDNSADISTFQLSLKSLVTARKPGKSTKKNASKQPPAKKRKVVEEHEDVGDHDRASPDMILSDIIVEEEEDRTDSIVEDYPGLCETDEAIARSIVRKDGNGRFRKRAKFCGRCDECKKKCGTCKVCENNPMFGGSWAKYKSKGCLRRTCIYSEDEVLMEMEVEPFNLETISPSKTQTLSDNTSSAFTTSTPSGSQSSALFSATHIRTLNFSISPKSQVLHEAPGTGSKENSTADPEVGDNKPLSRVLRNSGIKTLSPRPDPSSPMKEIDSSWATIHTMFVKDDEEELECKLETEDEEADTKVDGGFEDEDVSVADPLQPSKSTAVTILKSNTVTISSNAAPANRIVSNGPIVLTPVANPPLAVRKFMEAALQKKRAKLALQASQESLAVTSTTISTAVTTQPNTTDTPLIIPTRIVLPLPDFPRTAVTVAGTSAVKAPAVIEKAFTSGGATSTQLAAGRTIIGPGGVVNLPGNGASRSTPFTWDEKIRASLGEADKDASHVSKRVKERTIRRARLKQKRKKSESEEEEDDEEDDDDDENSNMDTLDTDLQKEIYGLGETLLRDLEKFNNQGLSGKEEVENVNPKMLRVTPVKTGVSQPKPCPTLPDTSPCNTSMPILTNTPLKPVQNQHYSPSPPFNRQKPFKKRIIELSSEPETSDKSSSKLILELSPEPETSDKPSSKPAPDSTTSSAKETKKKISTPEKPTLLPVTPKKPAEFAFKTPHKSPRVPRSPVRTPKTPRHLQASSLLHLLSPTAGFRKAVPLTPKGKEKTQNKDCLEERNRHASSLDTPVLDSPGDIPPPYSSVREPTTPRGEGKVYSAPYYTPSPSTRDSFISSSGKPLDTPGLVYLQAEGERLSSQGEESRSPGKLERRKSCRKNFKNAFQKTKLNSTQLGLLVEQGLSSCLEQQADMNQEQGSEVNPSLTPGVDRGLNYSLSANQTSPTQDFISRSYKESPRFLLSGPDSLNSRQTSPVGFKDQNRTRYLSPSAANLGFSVSGRNTDSESDHLVINSESEMERERRKNETETKFKKAKKVTRVRLDESLDDNAVGEGETLEDVQRAIQVFQESRSLSDTETSPFPGQEKSRDHSHPLPVSTASNQIHLSESDSELEDIDEGIQTKAESFISSLKVTCQRRREAVKPLAAPTSKNSTPQKLQSEATSRPGKRVSLISTSRKSPLKNDCTEWESRYDAHCLDKYAKHDKVRGIKKKAGTEKEEPEKKRKSSGGGSAVGGKKRRESGIKDEEMREAASPVKVSEATMLDQEEIQLAFSPRKSQRILTKTNNSSLPDFKSKPSNSNSNLKSEVEASSSSDLKDVTINDDDSSSDDCTSDDESENSSSQEEEDHENDELSEHDELGEEEEKGNSTILQKTSGEILKGETTGIELVNEKNKTSQMNDEDTSPVEAKKKDVPVKKEETKDVIKKTGEKGVPLKQVEDKKNESKIGRDRNNVEGGSNKAVEEKKGGNKKALENINDTEKKEEKKNDLKKVTEKASEKKITEEKKIENKKKEEKNNELKKVSEKKITQEKKTESKKKEEQKELKKVTEKVCEKKNTQDKKIESKKMEEQRKDSQKIEEKKNIINQKKSEENNVKDQKIVVKEHKSEKKKDARDNEKRKVQEKNSQSKKDEISIAEDKKQEDKKQEDKKREDKKQEDKKREDKKREDKKQEDKKQEYKKQEDKKREDKKREDKKQEDKKQEDKKLEGKKMAEKKIETRGEISDEIQQKRSTRNNPDLVQPAMELEDKIKTRNKKVESGSAKSLEKPAQSIDDHILAKKAKETGKNAQHKMDNSSIAETQRKKINTSSIKFVRGTTVLTYVKLYEIS